MDNRFPEHNDGLNKDQMFDQDDGMGWPSDQGDFILDDEPQSEDFLPEPSTLTRTQLSLIRPQEATTSASVTPAPGATTGPFFGVQGLKCVERERRRRMRCRNKCKLGDGECLAKCDECIGSGDDAILCDLLSEELIEYLVDYNIRFSNQESHNPALGLTLLGEHGPLTYWEPGNIRMALHELGHSVVTHTVANSGRVIASCHYEHKNMTGPLAMAALYKVGMPVPTHGDPLSEAYAEGFASFFDPTRSMQMKYGAPALWAKYADEYGRPSWNFNFRSQQAKTFLEKAWNDGYPWNYVKLVENFGDIPTDEKLETLVPRDAWEDPNQALDQFKSRMEQLEKKFSKGYPKFDYEPGCKPLKPPDPDCSLTGMAKKAYGKAIKRGRGKKR